MRILFVHEVNYRSKVIFEMHEFPELLALDGHSVSFFHFPEAPKHPKVSFKTRREIISGRAYPDASIELVTPPTVNGGVVERYLAPILNACALRNEIVGGGYDVIVLYAVPTTGWQTVAFARGRVPVVFRALDISHKIRPSVLAPLIKVAEKYIYANAAVVSANNPSMATYCVRVSGRTGPTVVNLPPIDLGHFANASSRVRREQLGLTPENRVILYMGSFFDFSGLDIVIEEMARLFKVRPQLRLVLVGGGVLDQRLRDMVDSLGVSDKVVFTGVVSYEDLPEYLAVADVAINPFIPQLVTDEALPHKVLQYMAAGIPVVSSSLRGLRAVLGESSGVTWAAGPTEVAKAATSLSDPDADTLSSIKERQLRFVRATFSREAALASLKETLALVR